MKCNVILGCDLFGFVSFRTQIFFQDVQKQKGKIVPVYGQHLFFVFVIVFLYVGAVVFVIGAVAFVKFNPMAGIKKED